jgi:uncharacterized SAM-binding protein YcdF (DUF218 family)
MTLVAGREQGGRASSAREPDWHPRAARRRGRRPRGRRARLLIRLVSVALVVVAAYGVLTFGQVWAASRQNDTRDAQAIVVLGAAQYNGRPSPVLEARLRHALDLYRQGVAPFIVVTGGRQVGDKYTEATTGERWLERHGVSQSVIKKEVDGRDTWESLSAVALFLRREGIRRVVLVSDNYHSMRLIGTARNLGLDPQVSPATPTESSVHELQSLGRETVAVGAGRIIGYRRLSNLLN